MVSERWAEVFAYGSLSQSNVHSALLDRPVELTYALVDGFSLELIAHPDCITLIPGRGLVDGQVFVATAYELDLVKEFLEISSNGRGFRYEFIRTEALLQHPDNRIVGANRTEVLTPIINNVTLLAGRNTPLMSGFSVAPLPAELNEITSRARLFHEQHLNSRNL